VVRAVAVVVLAILGLAWWALYLHPGETDQRFAWPVQPEMTALLMGAGYGSAVLFFVAVLVGRWWHQVTLGFLPTTAFTWLLAIATALHWDRFQHGHPAFLLWVWTYVITPVVVPVLWWINRRRDPGTTETKDVVIPTPLRGALFVLGGLLTVIALVMFVVPEVVIDVWPWSLTPLTARTVAAFVALPAVAWLAMAIDRRWSAARVMVATVALGLAMLLIAVWRAWSDFDQGNWLTYTYLAGLAGTLLGLVAMSVWMESAAGRAQAAVDRHD
jgi:hypothetical protein